MSYALYMKVRGKETCLGPVGSVGGYSDVIDAVERFDGVKRIPSLLHLVIEGETDDPQAAARDIFTMLAVGPELDEDVTASLQGLKQMLSKAKGSVIVLNNDAEKRRGEFACEG
jgi:hypothetical protein